MSGLPVRVLVVAAAVVVATVAPLVGGPAAAAPALGAVVVHRGGEPVSVTVTAATDGEAVLAFDASAPGVDWGVAGRESAVVRVDVDGRYVSDVVAFTATPTGRQLALGDMRAGEHTVTFRFAVDRSPAGAASAVLDRLSLSVAAPGTPEHTIRRHAPIVLGRTLDTLGGVFQNARTDTPMLAWHEVQSMPDPAQRRIVYSYIWSNEDGGTDSPGLMARWGRTTDIEWVYSVIVDARGERVPGQAVYQGPEHREMTFRGWYEDDHPVLATCTDNNNMCDRPMDGPVRFTLAADEARPPARAREYLMDIHPWTYQLMAAELLREGKVENPSDPRTPAVGDQRTYLYIEVDKDTGSGGLGWAPGLAVVVRLHGDPTAYRSDHGNASWTIKRDEPTPTAVELPRGTTVADIAAIQVTRVKGGFLDNGAPIVVTDINRAFFLDGAWLPQPSFVTLNGLSVRLGRHDTRTVWTGNMAAAS